MAQTLAVAALLMLMIALVSLDFRPEQIAFNTGAMLLTAAMALAYLVIGAFLLGRPATPAAAWFFRYAGISAMLLGLVIYTLIKSLLAGRVF